MVDAPGAAPLLPPWRVERILYDQPGVLVVDKPAGVAVTGGDDANPHSVIKRLEAFFSEQGRDVTLRTKLRLDDAMSGVVLFSTEQPQHVAPVAMGAAHLYQRTYLAVVVRSQVNQLTHQGILSSPVSSEKTKRRGAVMPGKRGQAFELHYRVLRENGARALVELHVEADGAEPSTLDELLSMFAESGAPVVGDRLRGGAPAFRLMFHAHRLRSAEWEFEARLPLALVQALAGETTLWDAAMSSRTTSTGSEPHALRDALLDAACLRQPLQARSNVYRLVNGAGDGLPGFTIDAYGAFATLNIYDESLFERADEIADTLIGLGFSGVYLKKRVKADLRNEDALKLAPDEVIRGVSAPANYCVDEFGMQVHVDLADGLSTGLFVDMRDNRMKTRGWAAVGRASRPAQMLNLFCYTCSFSVSAALSGAVTTSVDLAGKALERGRANFEANGLDPNEHRFIREDAMKFLARSARRGDLYDFIVLDPPSFATVGKGTFSVKNRYGEAVEDCLRLLAPGGRLLCVTNHTKTSEAALNSTIEAASGRVGRKIRSLKSLKPGADCPEHPEGLWPSKSSLCELE